MPSQCRRRRGRIKAPNLPISLDKSASSSPNPHQVARVSNSMDRISAITADIVRRDKEGSSCLPTATLEKVSNLSKSLWEEVLPLPLSTLPSLQDSLTTYELILVDIQQTLNSNDPLGMSDKTIDRQLGDFVVQFREALGSLESTISQRSSSNATYFFPNPRDILITGGQFISNPAPVVHDPVVREQSHKILQVLYIQCGVLFD